MSSIERGVVSIVVPARDEEGHIAECLRALGAQDYPLSLLEVIVVDGASNDRTVEVCRDTLWQYNFKQATVVRNRLASTPTSLNLGLDLAGGEYVCRVDARSVLPTDYVSRCQELLETNPSVCVVGGSQVAVPPSDPGVKQLGIARALNNRHSMGGSKYRSSTKSGPCDTAYLGFFRTADLETIGGWDEALPTNQDFDICQRMARLGTVWFLADLPVGYTGRSSYLSLGRQYRRFGQWKAVYWRTRRRPLLRQVILLGVLPLGAPLWLVLFRTAPMRTLGASLGFLFGLERHGANTPRAGLLGHLAGSAAMLVIGICWSVGAWAEMFLPTRYPAGHDRLDRS